MKPGSSMTSLTPGRTLSRTRTNTTAAFGFFPQLHTQIPQRRGSNHYHHHHHHGNEYFWYVLQSAGSIGMVDYSQLTVRKKRPTSTRIHLVSSL
jgi:hypothetical protein